VLRARGRLRHAAAKCDAQWIEARFRRALQGHKIVVRRLTDNAPGRVTGKPTDPEGVV
jgi:hypothetical protein